MLIASWRESWPELKSPIFHSPKAIVLLVPSVMSAIERFPLSPFLAMKKIPGGFAEAHGVVHGPTEPK